MHAARPHACSNSHLQPHCVRAHACYLAKHTQAAVPSNPRPTLRVEVTTREKEHLREPPADGVFVHGVSLEGAAWYVTPPPFVNSTSVPSCSTLLYNVLLACLVMYVTPPPFVNSTSVPYCSTLLYNVLLACLVMYVTPPPFVNSTSVPSCFTLFDSVLLACLVVYVAPPPFVYTANLFHRVSLCSTQFCSLV
jgi:hypothetical protein